MGMKQKMTVDARAEKAGTAPGINRLFHRNLAKERPQLFAAILGFNAAINADAAGDGRDPGADPSMVNGLLARSNRAKARLNGRYHQEFWDFEEESRRMALLDAATLNDLILSWGAAFCAPLLNRIVLKKEVELLDQAVGSRYLDFARGRGRFNIGEISEIIRVKETATAPENMRSLILSYGMHAHGICSAAWPAPLQTIENNRIERHLPDLFEHRSPVAEVHPSHLRAIWFSMKKILLKEVAPQWTPCFS